MGEEGNRIEAAIVQAEERIKSLSDEDLEKLQKDLQLTPDELNFCLAKQAEAYARGLISLEEAGSIRRILDRWQEASLAEKAVIRRLIRELARIVQESQYGVF